MTSPFLRKFLKSLQVILFIGALLTIAYLLKKDFEADTLRAMFQQAQLSWLGAALVVAFLGLVLKAIRLQDLSTNFGLYPGFKESFTIQVVSISLGIITPGRSGELSKMFLLSAKAPERRASAFWVMLVERLCDLVILSGFALFFLFSTPLVLGAISLLFGLMIPAYFCFKKYFPSALKQRLIALRSLKVITLLRVSLLSALAWILDGIFQWCILASIGAFLSPVMGVGINAVVAIAGIFSILPIGLGTVDLSALVLYQHSAGLSSEEIVFLLGAGRVLGLGLLFGLFSLVFLRQPQILAFKKKLEINVAEADGGEALASVTDKP